MRIYRVSVQITENYEFKIHAADGFSAEGGAERTWGELDSADAPTYLDPRTGPRIVTTVVDATDDGTGQVFDIHGQPVDFEHLED